MALPRNPGPGTRNPERQRDIRDVVLLHGWELDSGVWRDLAVRLAPRFRVHTPDLPGYGATPACTPYALETLAEAVACVAPRRCHVAGWSLGGQVALAWARRAPRQVERLALIATTPRFVRRPGWPHGIETGVLGDFARAVPVAARTGGGSAAGVFR